MSSAKKCDRCGKLFEAYIKRPGDKKASACKVLELKTAKIDGAWCEAEEYDLCDECSNELQSWLGMYNFPELKASTSIEKSIEAVGKVIANCYIESKGKADKCDFCIAREKCEELRSAEGTMCERCAKQGTSKCHCDCAREFELKETYTNASKAKF